MDVTSPAELSAVLLRLRATGFPELELDGQPTLLRGGFWAEMWLLTLAAGTHGELPDRLVLRLAPEADLAAWETTFQACVADQGFPTPRVRAFDFSPPAPLRAWCVMDFSPGTPILGGFSGPKALLGLRLLLTELPDILARAAAELHQLDPEPMKAALARVTDRAPGVDWLLERYQARAKQIDHAALQRTIARLAATTPAARPLVLCHGDLHPFNVLATESGHVVLDWTNGQITHPAFDLAFTHLLVSNPPLAAPRLFRPIINLAGRRMGKRFLRTYRLLSPHVIDDETFAWFQTMHTCRILLDLAGWRADGTLDEHPGHPWFLLEAKLLESLD